jgi:YbgC/YbaW family acyl-CoA thioester hydrolase
MKSIELKRRVRWADVDAAGRIYYARIFDYAGEGEWELLNSVGISRKELGRNYDFPRVHAECHFKRMLELGARFTLRFWPGKFGRTSIRYNFEVFLDEIPEEVAAHGSVTVVILHNGKPAEIPSEIRSALSSNEAVSPNSN